MARDMERGWLGMQGEVTSRAVALSTAGGSASPRRWMRRGRWVGEERFFGEAVRRRTVAAAAVESGEPVKRPNWCTS